jgi:hypothetical protein
MAIPGITRVKEISKTTNGSSGITTEVIYTATTRAFVTFGNYSQTGGGFLSNDAVHIIRNVGGPTPSQKTLFNIDATGANNGAAIAYYLQPGDTVRQECAFFSSGAVTSTIVVMELD